MSCVICDERGHKLDDGYSSGLDAMNADIDAVRVSIGHYHDGRLYEICDNCLHSPKANPIIHISIKEYNSYKLFVRIDEVWHTYRAINDYHMKSLKIEATKLDCKDTINMLDNVAVKFVEWLKNDEQGV